VKLLFVHQNMPGQFRHLAVSLAAEALNQVAFVTMRGDRPLPNVTQAIYEPPRIASPQTHGYLRQFEDAVLHGQAAAQACLALKGRGFSPDIVIAHPGWGESLFVREVFPGAAILNYGEFYYQPAGADVNFDPAQPADLDRLCALRARNAHLLLALEAADRTLCPTDWQKSVHPAAFHSRISVIFDGIDTDTVKPDASARFSLPNGRELTRGDEVVTYVSRGLEPTRGFPGFMRALPRLCALRPQAQIVIAGSDEPAYSGASPGGRSWREAMLEEVPVDRERVHFVGLLPYAQYVQLLQVSAAHVYMTTPFVMSWSAIEALAAACIVVGSRTAPVEEFITHGENGYLVDFFSPTELAETVAAVLADPVRHEPLRRAARARVLRDYAVAVCLPRQRDLVAEVAGKTSASA
jgi:glycosyltransferase involved in cell wall biosynthesis